MKIISNKCNMVTGIGFCLLPESYKTILKIFDELNSRAIADGICQIEDGPCLFSLIDFKNKSDKEKMSIIIDGEGDFIYYIAKLLELDCGVGHYGRFDFIYLSLENMIKQSDGYNFTEIVNELKARIPYSEELDIGWILEAGQCV